MCVSEGGAPMPENVPGVARVRGATYISNAEIDEIIQSGRFNRQWEKEGSKILVYNDTEWVAYMSDDMKVSRTEFYDSYNFAGTSDWAEDLQYFMDESGSNDGYDNDYEYEIDDFWSPCKNSYNTLDVLDQFKEDIPGNCVEQYILDIQVATLETVLNKYKKLIGDGYDSKFSTYKRYVTDQVPLQVNKSKRGDRDVLDPLYIPNATYHLNEAEGFWKDTGDEWGVDESRIKFGKRHMKSSNGCQYAGEDVLECIIKKRDDWFYNYPLVDQVSVYNPKDFFPQATDLLNRFKITLLSDLVDVTTLRSLLRLLGAACDACQAICDAVNDPQNAFMTVFSYLLGAGLGRAGFKNAANSRRGLTEVEYNSLGKVKTKLDMVQDIRGAVCPR
ncbi:glycoside hydrolase family 18 protein [Hypoxylon sp. CI-4A]|nr:glycoside hydrolase family 18 protein [Hypoxylon sp. CI-4A]